MHKIVLDHGYVEYIEHWGSDERIIEAARMSTNKGFQGWGRWECNLCGHSQPHDFNVSLYNPDKLDYDECPKCRKRAYDGLDIKGGPGDEKLLAYLWNNKHATPFEMAGMVIEVQAPIFVFREWHRHRTQSYNEMSARYVPLPDMNYMPTVKRLMLNSKTNKQAGTIKDAEELTAAGAETFQAMLTAMYAEQQNVYEKALVMGVPKELARIHLPVGRYSRMRASANLRNWLAFLTLRMDEKAQWEIRQFANEVGVLIAEHFPRTWELFINA